VFGQLFSTLPAGSARTGQHNNIQLGQAATVADYLDIYQPAGGIRGDLVTKAGFKNTFFRMNPQVQNASICGNFSHSTYHSMKIRQALQRRDYLQFNYPGERPSDYTGGQGQYNDYRDN
jgi:hypothetical protein